MYEISRVGFTDTLIFPAIEGGKGYIDLSLRNFVNPEVEWYKGKNRIENKLPYEFSYNEDDGTYSLVINNVSKSDGGIYKCIVRSQGHEVPIRCDLQVKEKELAPRFVDDEVDQEAVIPFDKGQEIGKTFTIVGTPPPFVTWYKADVPLFDTKRIDIRSRDNLHHLAIRDAKPKDSGTYKCEARSPLGTAYRTFDFKFKGIYTINYMFLIHLIAGRFSSGKQPKVI